MVRIALGLFAMTSYVFGSGNIAMVPEPSTYLMMGAGLGALLYARNRFGKKK